MKYFFLIGALASWNMFAHAQQLKGRVYDAATNHPLAGATIKFSGAGGTSTDKEGNFSIDCSKINSVIVSFVGYQPVSLAVHNCNDPLSIALSVTGQYLNEVEISATSSQNKSLLHQPVSITKLSPVELKRGTGLFLDDAINTNVPGVTMNRRTVSAGQQFNIRGYGNGTRGTRGINSNFDGQGYKVYLNGIPVTDAEGITTLDDIDFGSVGAVEVTKGPAGTLYGLAIAGAVHLKTMQPQKGKTSVSQEVLMGNYGLQRYTTQLQTASDKISLLVNYGHQKSDGFSIHNKSEKDFVSMAGDFQPGEKQSINTYIGYSNSYDERLGELTLTQWENNDYSGNPEYIKRNAHSKVITFRAGVGHTYNFNNHLSHTTVLFGTGTTGNASSAGGWTDKSAMNYGLRSTLNSRFAVNKAMNVSGITGVETQRQDAQLTGYSMKQHPADTNAKWTYGVNPYWIINTATSNVATTSKTTSLFTQWTLAFMQDISLTAGVGVSSMKIELNDRFNPALITRTAFYEKNYTGMVSPHVAINKVFNKRFSVYTSYSKGYKAPVSSYFYITTPAVTTPPTPATGRVNESLKPETGNQWEAGTKGQLMNNKLSYELAYFHAVFSNKMTAVAVQSPASPNTNLYSYVVYGGREIHKGAEVLVKLTALQSDKGFFTAVRPFANFTYSDFKYGSSFIIQKSAVLTEDYSNNKVAGVAKIVANAGVDVTMKYGLYANINYNYKDKMPITSLNDLYAGSYHLLNGKIGIQRSLCRHFDAEAYAGATNLTHTRYYLMVFVNQLPDAYIPAPRNAVVFGGLNVKYTF
jgi:iron complex outermembrane receptor protein